MLNLIKRQNDNDYSIIDKTYLCIKDQHEAIAMIRFYIFSKRLHLKHKGLSDARVVLLIKKIWLVSTLNS